MHRHFSTRAPRAAVVTLAVLGAIPAAGSAVEGIGTSLSEVVGLSSDGSVVALTEHLPPVPPATYRDVASRWTRTGGLEPLGDLGGIDPYSGGPYSAAAGVSGDGTTIVGGSSASEGAEAFRWSLATGMVGLGRMGDVPTQSSASAASDDGSVIVGGATTSDGDQAFRWTSAGGMVGLGDLGATPPYRSSAHDVSADGAIVVGHGRSARAFVEAFRWTDVEGMVGLGGLPAETIRSSARAVSADGSTIVGAAARGSEDEAFRWTPSGGMVGLGRLPGGTWSQALDVSEDGSVVVGWGSSDGQGQEAFVWTEAGGLQPLDDFLVEGGHVVGDFQLLAATAISADGQTIGGVASDSYTGSLQGFVVALPEPDSAAMLAMGVLAHAAREARRRVARAAVPAKRP